jgi:putative addiction module component (TIGR02574 family)
MENTLLKELSKLNKNEKLLLVEALWDSIASDPGKVEIPEHHVKLLEERLKTLNEDKANAKSWVDIRQKYM